MMRGANILCFAKDYSEDPTSNNHVMRVLARDNKVLWYNSLSTRTPNLTSKGDLRKIGNKLRSFAKGPLEVSPGLSVYTPIVVPMPHSTVAQRVNEQILRVSTKLLRSRYGMNPFQLWSFIPSAAKYVGKMGEALSLYYCTDEWSQFSAVDTEKTVALEVEMLRKVDLAFATAHTLVERKRAHNPNVFLASHGVDYEHFRRALDPATTIPDELAHVTGPIVGFFGLVEDWINIELFAKIAERRPDVTVAIIGKAKVDLSALKKHSNIILIDRRPYAELPRYCKAFTVALCPFRINELTLNVNPIKLREYMSAGLAVVSTDIPECRYYPEHCWVAKTDDEYLALVDKALAEYSPESRAQRSLSMAEETWEKKVAKLGEHVMAALERKARSR